MIYVQNLSAEKSVCGSTKSLLSLTECCAHLDENYKYQMMIKGRLIAVFCGLHGARILDTRVNFGK